MPGSGTEIERISIIMFFDIGTFRLSADLFSLLSSV